MKDMRKRLGDIKIHGQYHRGTVWIELKKRQSYSLAQIIGKNNDSSKEYSYKFFFNIPRGVVCSYLLKKIKIDGKLLNMCEMGGYPYREYTQIYIDFDRISDAKRFVGKIKKGKRFELFVFDIEDNYKEKIGKLEDIVRLEVL